MKAIKQVASLLLATILSVGAASAQGKAKSKQPAKSYLLETAIPKRPAGQRDVLGLRHAPMPVVRVGFIGLGMRGPGAVERFTQIEGVEIKALCDLPPTVSRRAKPSSRRQASPKQLLTAVAKTHGSSSATAPTLTWSTSLPTGHVTPL